MTPRPATQPASPPTSPSANDHAGPRIVLVGATLTGNRGAEAMLRAALQRIPELVPHARFTLLSLYPRDDRAENHDPALRIVPFSPLHLLLLAFPLALLAGTLLRLHLPPRFFLWTRSLRALHDADLMIDLSGISFVDGRGAILLYNVLLVLLPALLRTPVMKYSQALGPFRTTLNRWCARRLLPQVARIAARGPTTKRFLDELSLSPGQVRECADAAFALQVGAPARQTIEPLLAQPLFTRPVVAVSASSVVDKLCRRGGVDYVAQMQTLIRHLIDDRGYHVCLVAHSARPGRRSTKNNDLPVCRRIADLVGRPECQFPETPYNAEALRALIGHCRFLVASRFHAMIAGLAEGVPTLLVGWSHKYAEVLASFTLEAYALDYADLSAARLRQMFAQLEEDEDEVRRRIREHLPAVLESSLSNARLAAELLAQRTP